jgi:hypothetical protein
VEEKRGRFSVRIKYQVPIDPLLIFDVASD